MKSTPTSTFEHNATVRVSLEEFEYLKKCEKELYDIKDIINEMLGGKQ